MTMEYPTAEKLLYLSNCVYYAGSRSKKVEN